MLNDPQIIHMEPAKHHFSFHVLLLFIPALVFVTLLVYLFSISTKHFAATTDGPTVLGESEFNEK